MNLKVLIAVLSVILAVLLAFVPYVHRLNTPTAPSVPQSSVASTSLQSTTQISSAATSLPTSAPATQAPTQHTTQPTSKPATKPSSNDPKVDSFIQEKMKSWICPVKVSFGEVVGSRTFASSRGGGKRAHAGLDFVAPHGTMVYAITSGTVQRVAVFYQNTWAVEVVNDDGSILRYCEIATELKVGDRVKQGDVIGSILRAESGTEMLHMEVYYGDGEGMLTQTGNSTYKYVDSSKSFLRRSDLLDPTFLKDLPQG